MTKVKSPYDDDVVAALENNEDLPEGTVLNFYTRGKFDDRTLEHLIANATMNDPSQAAPAKTTSKTTSTAPSS